MKQSHWLVYAASTIAMTVGCMDRPVVGGESPANSRTGDTPTDEPPMAPPTTGTLPGTPVDGMSGSRDGFGLAVEGDAELAAGFRVAIASCRGDLIRDPVVVPLEAFTIPGGIDEFEHRPYDPESAHSFGDYFVSLPTGCYDVTVTPVDAHGETIRDCSVAHAYGVMVGEETTTEIVLVSQCQRVSGGSLDIVSTFNRPPIIETLVYDKFAAQCEEVTLCAVAYDPDNDPLEFAWELPSGVHAQFTDGQYVYDGTLVEREDGVCLLGPSEGITAVGDGRHRSCITISSSTSMTADLALRVYDIRYDAEGPADAPPQILHYGPDGAEALPSGWRSAQRLENYLAEQEGYSIGDIPESLHSRDVRYFPFFVGDASLCSTDSMDPFHAGCIEPAQAVALSP